MKLPARVAKPKKVLIYGPPMGGKSTLAAQAALAESVTRVVWIDMEDGYSVLYDLPEAAQAKISLIRLPDTTSYPIAAESMLHICRNKSTPTKLCDDHGRKDCPICTKANKPMSEVFLASYGPETLVVLDSMSQLSASVLALLTQGQPDTYKATYDDWGNQGKLLNIFLSHIQQATCHVVCIAHEIMAEMEDKSTKLIPQIGTSTFTRNAARSFNEIIYARVIDGKHQFGSSTTWKPNILTGSESKLRIENGHTLAQLLDDSLPEVEAKQAVKIKL